MRRHIFIHLLAMATLLVSGFVPPAATQAQSDLTVASSLPADAELAPSQGSRSGTPLTMGDRVVPDLPRKVGPLAPAAVDYTVSGVVRDASTGWPLYSSIHVTGGSVDVTAWTDPVTGAYSLSLPEATAFTLTFTAWVEGYEPQVLNVPALTAPVVLDANLEADLYACTAPGYIRTTYFEESFDTLTAFPGGGWDQADVSGSTGEWATGTTTQDPAGRLPHSGARLAYFNAGTADRNTQTRLYRTTGLDLSGMSGADISVWVFHDAGDSARNDRVQVQTSTDGGGTWANVGSAISRYSETEMWQEHRFDLSAYTGPGMTDVRIGFLGLSGASFFAKGNDVHIDDVAVFDPGCAPPPGGLVVGSVYDANTLEPLAGATVENESGDATTTRTTPDPNVDDGFYTLYVPAGTSTLTANLDAYLPGTGEVTVSAGQTVERDLSLSAGRLVATPADLHATVMLGNSTNLSLSLDNDGTGPLAYDIGELYRGFQPFGESGSIPDLPASGDTAELCGGPDAFGYTCADSSGFRGPAYQWIDITATGTQLLGLADDNFVGPLPIGFAFDFYGTPQTEIYAGSNGFLTFGAGSDEFQTQCPLPNVTEPNNLIALMWDDLDVGTSGSVYAQGFADCPYVGGQACAIISYLDMAHFDTPPGSAGTWQAILFESGSILMQFQAVGDADGSTCTIGIENADGTDGLTYQCDTAGTIQPGLALCFAYPGEPSNCMPGTVSWLTETPASGTLAASGQQLIDVGFNAAAVAQPGDYFAALRLDNDTPYGEPWLPVMMTVEPPPDWGKVQGTVTSRGYCDAYPQPLPNAQVMIQGSQGGSWTLMTGADGRYELWLDSAESPLDVIVVAADHIGTQKTNVTLSAGATATVDLALRLDVPCVAVAPAEIAVTLAEGAVETVPLTVTNSGAAALAFAMVEEEGGTGGTSVIPSTGGPIVGSDVEMVVDDNTLDDQVGYGSMTASEQFMWFNRFTPPPGSFPFTLETISLVFPSGEVAPGDAIELVVYADTTDNGYPHDARWMASYVATVQVADSSTWNHYTLSPPVVMALPGDVLIGAINRYVESGVTPASAPLAIDTTASQGRSWVGVWSTDPPSPPLLPPDSQFVTADDLGLPGNFMIRGAGTLGIHDAVSWLSEDPDTGSVPSGGSRTVGVTLDAGVAGGPGQYEAFLHVVNDDPVWSDVSVPVTLNVVEGETYTLDVSVAGNGTVAVTPLKGTYAYGEEVTLTATPDPGWAFQGWSGDASGSANPLALTITEDTAVTATFVEEGYTLAVSVVGNGTVTVQPEQTTYSHGDVVTLTATADSGWVFDGWSGDVSSGTSPLALTITDDTLVIATFIEEAYTLDVSTVGSGTVSVDPLQTTYTYGEVVTLTAVPETGWSFQGWSGDATGSTNPLVLTITDDTAITATFVEETYTLTVDVVGSGTVSVDPLQTTYSHGDVVTLTAVPETGWSFQSWSGDATGSTNPLVLTITQDTVVTATFVEEGYSLTLDVVGSGTVTANPDLATYTHGQVVTLTATPAAGWSFSHWSGDADGSTNPLVLTIVEDTAVTATFVEEAYTLDVHTVGSGTVAVTPLKDTYTYGEEVTLTAVPETGWSFQGWSGDATGSTNPLVLTITGDTAVTATFVAETQTFTLDVSVVGNGTVSVDPDLPAYTHGQVVTLTPTPDPGWAFSHWSGDATGSTNPLVLTITKDTAVTATFTAEAYTLHIDVVGGGVVALDPDEPTYAYGDVVTLTAIPDLGWTFQGWSGDATGNTNPLVVTITEDTAVTATFVEKTYTLTVGVTGNGTVTVDPLQSTYDYGAEVTLTPVPDAGWVFSGWSGDATGSDNPLVLTITKDTAVTALFVKEGYSLTIDVVGDGTVIADPDRAYYVYGQEVTLTAEPKDGWTFAGWSGDVDSTDNPLVLTITGNTAVTATFVEEAYTLDVTTAGQGMVTTEPEQETYRYGDVVTLTAVPDANWLFSHWSGDGSGSANPLVLTITKDTAVTATFVREGYSLTVDVAGYGSVTADPDLAVYKHGQVVTLTAVPQDGWVFSGWSGDAGGSTNPLVLTITEDTAVTATFVAETYTLDVNVVGQGSVTVRPDQPTYGYCAAITLTAVPAPGWRFSRWSGDATGSTNPLGLTIKEDTEITAVFIAETYTLDVNVVGEGAVTIEPDKDTYTYGEKVTLTATAAADWAFDGWSGDAGGSTNPLVLTITGNTAVTATFVETPCALHVEVDGSGTVTVNPGKPAYAYGEVITLTATPDPGWDFSHWSGDVSSSDNPLILPLTGTSTSVTAIFVPSQVEYKVCLPLITRARGVDQLTRSR